MGNSNSVILLHQKQCSVRRSHMQCHLPSFSWRTIRHLELNAQAHNIRLTRPPRATPTAQPDTHRQTGRRIPSYVYAYMAVYIIWCVNTTLFVTLHTACCLAAPFLMTGFLFVASALNVVNPERRRPSWDAYFMRLASLAASRASCLKRRSAKQQIHLSRL